MLHVFIGEILANMTQVSNVAPGPLVLIKEIFVKMKYNNRKYIFFNSTVKILKS
jgi:hypothetical protein